MALPQSDPQRDQRRRQHDDRELAPEQSALELLVVLIRVHARSPTAPVFSVFSQRISAWRISATYAAAVIAHSSGP